MSGEAAGGEAVPLTTPIYETTTFVFESAEEVRDYNEGRSGKYLYSRYANPTVTAVERKVAKLEGAEGALVLSSGQAATTNALLALTAAGDESSAARRSTAARCTCWPTCCRGSASRRGS